jgi:hypothetical protein
MCSYGFLLVIGFVSQMRLMDINLEKTWTLNGLFFSTDFFTHFYVTERRKIERRIRRLEKQQRTSDDNPQRLADIAEQLTQLKEDLEYVRVLVLSLSAHTPAIIVCVKNPYFNLSTYQSFNPCVAEWITLCLHLSKGNVWVVIFPECLLTLWLSLLLFL